MKVPKVLTIPRQKLFLSLYLLLFSVTVKKKKKEQLWKKSIYSASEFKKGYNPSSWKGAGRKVRWLV